MPKKYPQFVKCNRCRNQTKRKDIVNVVVNPEDGGMIGIDYCRKCYDAIKKQAQKFIDMAGGYTYMLPNQFGAKGDK